SNPPSASSSRRFDVTVRGGGIVGQTLALLLARERLRVALVSTPRPPSAHDDVRAYALNAASRDLLRSVRAWPEAGPNPSSDIPPTITSVTAMDVWGDDGGRLRFDAAPIGQDALTWIVD